MRHYLCHCQISTHLIPCFGRKTKPKNSQFRQLTTQKFSVQTAYQVALCLHNQSQVEHSFAQFHHTTWNKVWTLNVPPKVRTFFGEHIRTAYQPMTTYTGSRSRWTLNVSYAANIMRLQATFCGPVLSQERFGAWLRVEFRRATKRRIFSYSSADKLSKLELERWAVTAWAIWNARNKFYRFKLIQG